MMKLSPSVLSADFCCLYDSTKQVLDAGADWIHFDVMDGVFVDNISFGLPVLETLSKALPEAYFDVHLMITHPKRFVTRFAQAGASSITFHVDAEDDIQETIDAIKAEGVKVGLTMKPATPLSSVFPYLKQVDLILMMGVEPGHGGQSFMPETLDKLRELRAECAKQGVNPDVSVDGGVKVATTAPQCIEAGANVLVAGSAVFCAKDIPATVAAFKALG